VFRLAIFWAPIDTIRIGFELQARPYMARTNEPCFAFVLRFEGFAREWISSITTKPPRRTSTARRRRLAGSVSDEPHHRQDLLSYRVVDNLK
jgi:hypothetical protein